MTTLTITRAIGCTRISTDIQRDGYGQDVQAEEIRKEAKRLGLVLEQIVEEVESGAKSDRETVQQYYQLAEENPGIHFIFPRVDRIGRRAEYILQIVRELHARKAQVHVVGFPADLRTKEGFMVLTMLAGVAEYDHRNIVTNLQTSKVKKAREGKWAHGRAPFGYQISRLPNGKADTLLLRPELKEIIRMAFEYGLEHGRSATATYLNQLGYKTEKGLNWSGSTVGYMFKNPVYKGQYILGQRTRPPSEWITIQVEPCVTPELWQALQDRYADRKTHRPSRALVSDLLASRLICATCGRTISLTTLNKGQPVYRYYFCKSVYPSVYLQANREPCTNRARFRAGAMDEACWQAFVREISNPDRLRELFTKQEVDNTQQARIQELKTQLDRIWELYTTGKRGMDDVERMAAPVDLELKQLIKAQQASAPDVNVAAMAEGFRVRLANVGPEHWESWFKEFHVRFVMNGREIVEVKFILSI